MASVFNRLGYYILLLLSAASAVGSFVIGVLAGGAKGAAQHWLLVAGSALVLAGIAVNAIEKVRDSKSIKAAEDIAIQAQTDLTATLNGALAPITSYLGKISASPRAMRKAEIGQLRQAIVQSAVKLTHEKARSAYYEMVGSDLNRVCYSGRAESPREKFSAGTSDGDYLLNLVQAKDLIFVEDIASNPLVTPTTSGYRTVIAVSVTAGDEALGLLTVDAPDIGDLTNVHVQLVRVLANLLGSGIFQA
ncbi:GAF domain-containing protein [Streptomyces sp. NPDC020996]|uniref:GAF domain-containing protein n=1 Tax=Streptomyces sp. NPDC020996 TaxID=3154791 RepID=UPI0033C741A1